MRVVLGCFLLISMLAGCSENGLKQATAPVQNYSVMLDSLTRLPVSDSMEFVRITRQLKKYEAGRRFPDTLKLRRVEAMASWVRSRKGADSAFTVYLEAYDEAIRSGDSLLLAGLCFRMGKWKLGEGSNRMAQGFFARARGIYDDGSHPRELAKTILSQAQVLRELSDLDGAQRLAMEAIRMVTLAYPEAEAEAGSAFLTSGSVFADTHADSMARVSYKKAFQIYSAVPDSVGMAEALGNLGLLYRKSNPASALFYYHQALALADPDRFPFESVVFL